MSSIARRRRIPRNRAPIPHESAQIAETPQKPAPNRLIYGFTRRAGQRILEAQGAERHLIALFAVVLVLVGALIWYVGAGYTMFGILGVLDWVGISLPYHPALWLLPVALTLAEVGLKRPKLDIFFGAWIVAFAVDAGTTALGLLPYVTVAGPVPAWSWALAFGALVAWSAEAIAQAGLYTLWRYARGMER